MAVCNSAILFLDEAYGIGRGETDDDRSSQFKTESVNAMLTFMENHRDDAMIIFAGYEDLMTLLARANQGFIPVSASASNFRH